MYKHFYQLATNPFRLAPEPDFCFSHTGYKRAREYLEFALAQGEGFVLVTGRPGTGKTMLVETFLKEINTSEVVARRIAVSNYAAADLLRAVAYAYGIDAAGMDEGTMHHRIQQFFVQQEQIGRRVLLIIDEAQSLSHAALEELRILADLQTESRLMLQLFLVGQESLQELMSAPAMEQFQQRVIANYQLVPLDLQDTRSYIEHRLRQAGWKGDPEFSSDAVLSIYQLSNGVPRHINKICNRLLLLGFGKASHAFEEQDVLEISAEMHDERLTPLEIHQATRYDADNVATITEIRDGQISVTNLAIRVDTLDACAATLAEGSQQSIPGKETFIARHHESPAINDAPVASPDIDVVAALAVTSESLHAANTSHAVTEHSDSMAIDHPAGRRRPVRKKALAFTATLLILVTVFIASEPSFTDHFSRWSQQLAALQQGLGAADVDNERQAQAKGTAVGVINRHQAKAKMPRSVEESPVQPMTIAVNVAPTDVLQADKIETLLAQGRQALDDYRLVTPEGDNAYEYLLAALQLDPANVRARTGIQEIVDIYIVLATKTLGSNEIARASRYLDRGLGIQPDNPELLAMKDTVNSKMEAATVTHGTASTAGQLARDNTTLQKQTALKKRNAAGRRRDVSAATGRDI